MDQIKIGQFISKKRKEKNITQSTLAEMLGITDRAISKWENGICMPDVGTIPELCKILGITINDLFSGEMVDMKEYDKKAEINLLEMARLEENSNKKLLTAMYVLIIVSSISFATIVMLSQQFINDELLKTIVCIVATLFFIPTVFFGIKLEADAGYYECKNCNHKFIPTYRSVLKSTHIGTTRYLVCPKCSKKSWSKKVMSK